jgi:hypothetical protein
MRITKRQLQRIIREESHRLRRSRKLHEDAIDSELDNLHKNIGDDIEHIRGLKDDIKDDHEEELHAEKERHDESIRRRTLKRQIRRVIREEQGYDASEDERLGMEHGALDTLDLDGDHEEEEHDRRDDAEFEEHDHTPEVHVHVHAESKRRLKNSLRRIVRENTRPSRRRRVSRRRR